MSKLEQGIGSVVQKAAPIATTGIGLTAMFEVMPGILGIIAAILGISVTLLVRKKTKKQLELLDLDLEEKRKRRKGD